MCRGKRESSVCTGSCSCSGGLCLPWETDAVNAVMKWLQPGSHTSGRRASSVTKIQSAGKQKGVAAPDQRLQLPGCHIVSLLSRCCAQAPPYPVSTAIQSEGPKDATGRASAAIKAALKAVRDRRIQQELTAALQPHRPQEPALARQQAQAPLQQPPAPWAATCCCRTAGWCETTKGGKCHRTQSCKVALRRAAAQARWRHPAVEQQCRRLRAS